eukprot:SAG22_NODE_12947_length_424_cov_0.621538_2_plen_51_part_01
MELEPEPEPELRPADWLDDGDGGSFLGIQDAAERQRLAMRGTCDPTTGAWR